VSSLNGKTSGEVRLLNAAQVVVIAALAVFLFANAMTKEVGHDEHMYCTAGYLTAQGKMIYRDFSYATQLPYHPLVLALLYKVSGTSHYLLAGRLFSVACDIGILIVIAGMCTGALKQYGAWAHFYSLAALIIYATNYFVRYASGFAWNHSMTILCLVLGLWVFLTAELDKPSFRRLCGVGALATVATFTRPTAALVYVVFAVAVLIAAPARLRRKKVTALPFIVGSFVFALWPLSIIAAAPKAFFLDVARIPALNAVFQKQSGLVYAKGHLTAAALLSPCYLGLILLGVYLAVVLLVHRREITHTEKWKGRLCAAVTAAAVAGVFIPPAMWLQYWAAPAAFAVILLARPFGSLCKAVAEAKLQRFYLLIAAGILVTTAAAGIYDSWSEGITQLKGLVNVKAWTPIKVHTISQDIHAAIIVPGPVLTLGPLYAIEGGNKIYDQLSAGAFVYRVADKLSAAERKLVHAAGPAELKELIAARPPGAVVLGVEPKELEEPILDEVVGPRWYVTAYGEKGPFAYFRDIANAPAEK
jgi:hypothetical protein